jgi:hypothetical protein
MRAYLTVFSLLALTVGIAVFTTIFVSDVGMDYRLYRAWLSILLSFTTLISNAALSYYFAKGDSIPGRGRKAREK